MLKWYRIIAISKVARTFLNLADLNSTTFRIAQIEHFSSAKGINEDDEDKNARSLKAKNYFSSHLLALMFVIPLFYVCNYQFLQTFPTAVDASRIQAELQKRKIVHRIK